MKNYFITVNPNVSGFIKKQKGINCLLSIGILGVTAGVLTAERLFVEQQDEIKRLKDRVRALECEKADIH